MTKSANLFSYPNTDNVATHLRQYVLTCQRHAFQRHNLFRVAVSGGSLPATLSKGLLAEAQDADDTPDFSRWEIFFADERAVPLDHDDSNYGLLKKDLLDKIPEALGKPTVHPIDVSVLSNTQEIADRYQETVMSSFAGKDSVRLPQFDLILLGCGPDGHTCSLFPGHALLRENDAWVAAIEDSPKPPPRRITLTLPVVVHAHHIAFVATGGGKKGILKQILETEEGASLPCGLVNQGAGDKVSWFCDDAATEGVRAPGIVAEPTHLVGREPYGLSERTRVVARHLHRRFLHQRNGGKNEVVNLMQLLDGKTKKESARLFYEMLVLKTKGFVDVRQDEAYGDILVQAYGDILVQKVLQWDQIYEAFCL